MNLINSFASYGELVSVIQPKDYELLIKTWKLDLKFLELKKYQLSYIAQQKIRENFKFILIFDQKLELS